MSTDYDAIADRYRRAKQQPWRRDVEAFTFLGLLGDLTGRSVADLACGEGFYTRMLPHLGAARVVGVDQSQGMIDLARAAETEHPRGITYHIQDCRTLRLEESFDVVSAAYLLNYASTRRELCDMAMAIVGHLRPGGRFVAMNANPDLEFGRGASYRKYGFEVLGPPSPREGDAYTWRFHLEDGPVDVENRWLPAAAYEEALSAAGFADVRWHAPGLSPMAAWRQPSDFYGDLLAHPPIIAIECTT